MTEMNKNYEEEIHTILDYLKKGINKENLEEKRHNYIFQLKTMINDESSAKITGSSPEFLILFQLAFPDDTMSRKKSLDATRCIFNTMLLYPDSRDIFIENNGIQYIIKEYMNFFELSLIDKKEYFDFLFVYTHILFLLTTQPGKAITILMELDIFQIINKFFWYFETYLRSYDIWSEQNISTVQEYMKLLFNLIRYEDKPHLVSIPPLIKLLHLSLTRFVHPLTFEIINCLLNLPISEFFSSENDPEYCIEHFLKILDSLLSNIDLGIHSNDLPSSFNLDPTVETKILSLVTFLRKILKHSVGSIETLLASRLLPQNKSNTLSSRALRAMTVPSPLIRESISWLLFELNHSDETQFINSIGFGYASGFLVSQGIPFVSPNSKDFKAIHGINPITGQSLEAESMSLSDIPEMTEEEKERDAERLFVMFQRLEKNRILSVKNPIRDALESGRLPE
ncbi:hypothetical protein PCANB_001038 [Pneumocystis canis]|nr:hypothetical protein PCANB_001038 [Pneumocystis canis]